MKSMASNFFKTISRIKLIERWSLHRNTISENVAEHSWETATIAHFLGVINTSIYGGGLNPERLATLALYHDCTEAITGDLPTPVKYYSDRLTNAYQEIESAAENILIKMLPSQLQEALSNVVMHNRLSFSEKKYLKAADSLSAFIKAKAEYDNGNKDYTEVLVNIKQRITEYQLPEVNYFMKNFIDGAEGSNINLSKIA